MLYLSYNLLGYHIDPQSDVIFVVQPTKLSHMSAIRC